MLEQIVVPQLSSGENIRTLETGGIVLSIMENFPFEDKTVSIKIGDTLVVQQHRDAPALQLVELILGAVKSHSVDVPQTDDMTLVVIKRIA